jgi:uncharacterized membrane protein YcaP (DUF421 family)
LLHLGQHGKLVTELGIVTVRTVVLWAVALAVLRLAGKRTMGKLDVFDFVVVITLGSAVAIGMEADNRMLPSMVPVVLLGALQWGLSKLTLASPFLERLTRGQPVVLVDQGQPIHRALVGEHVTTGDLEMELRQKGFTRLEEVDKALLEPTGKVSVVPSPIARPLTHSDLAAIAAAVVDEWQRRQGGGQGRGGGETNHQGRHGG